MSLMSDTIKGIERKTGLKPKGRNFTVMANEHNTIRLEVRAKELLVYRKFKKEKEGLEQKVALDRAVSYVNGYLFSHGIVVDGEKITHPNQLKRKTQKVNTMTTKKTQSKKTQSRAAAVAAKRKAANSTKAKRTRTAQKTNGASEARAKKSTTKAAKSSGYSLGKAIKKPDQTKAIKALQKEYPDGMTFTAAARAFIEKHWDNDAVIHGVEQLAGYEGLAHPDINKVRRAMKRKGQWK